MNECKPLLHASSVCSLTHQCALLMHLAYGPCGERKEVDYSLELRLIHKRRRSCLLQHVGTLEYVENGNVFTNAGVCHST